MRKETYQDKLKLVAIMAMTIDHIGLFFLPGWEVLRVIGRLAMPIFCLFAGYNYKNKARKEILKYAILLDMLRFFALGGFPVFSILIPIYLGQAIIQRIYTPTDDFIGSMFQLLPLIALAPATVAIWDYGTLAVLFVMIGYLLKHDSVHKQSYILIVVFINFCYSQISFGFTYHNFILLCIESVMLYYLLYDVKSYEQESQSKMDIRKVTRHSLAYYWLTTAGMTIIWVVLR